jgi:hypothetical protein
VLAVFGAAGVLSKSRAAPKSGVPPRGGASIAVEPPVVTVSVRAIQPVHLIITADGQVKFQGVLRKDEARTFQGNQTVRVELEKGGVASITVNGHHVGKPGDTASAFTANYTPDSFRGSPSGNSP